MQLETKHAKFYFCKTNYQKLNILKKNYNLSAHSSLGQRSGHGMADSLLRVPWGWNQGISCTMFLSGISWEEFTSQLVQIIGRILLSVVVGRRFPFPCWLSAQTHSQFLEPIPIAHHMPPSIFIAKMERLLSLNASHSLKYLLPGRVQFLLMFIWLCPSPEK